MGGIEDEDRVLAWTVPSFRQRVYWPLRESPRNARALYVSLTRQSGHRSDPPVRTEARVRCELRTDEIGWLIAGRVLRPLRWSSSSATRASSRPPRLVLQRWAVTVSGVAA
jgi:hypothetical protein